MIEDMPSNNATIGANANAMMTSLFDVIMVCAKLFHDFIERQELPVHKNKY